MKSRPLPPTSRPNFPPAPDSGADAALGSDKLLLDPQRMRVLVEILADLTARPAPLTSVGIARVTLDVLAHYHMAGHAVPVRVLIGNAAYLAKRAKHGGDPLHPGLLAAWANSGAHAVKLGGGAPDPLSGGWGGWLVPLLLHDGGGAFLLDAGLGRASRPEWGITVGPLIAHAGPNFLFGNQPIPVRHPDGTGVLYTAAPTMRGYLSDPQWQSATVADQTAAVIAAFDTWLAANPWTGGK